MTPTANEMPAQNPPPYRRRGNLDVEPGLGDMLSHFTQWVKGLFTPKPKGPDLSRLYVLSVDFAVKPEAVDDIEKGLQPLRDKYGIDFLVLEPGMKLSRFDDI